MTSHRLQVPALEDSLVGERDDHRLGPRGDECVSGWDRDCLRDLGRVHVEHGEFAGIFERQDEVAAAATAGDVGDLAFHRADHGFVELLFRRLALRHLPELGRSVSRGDQEVVPIRHDRQAAHSGSEPAHALELPAVFEVPDPDGAVFFRSSGNRAVAIGQEREGLNAVVVLGKPEDFSAGRGLAETNDPVFAAQDQSLAVARDGNGGQSAGTSLESAQLFTRLQVE